MAADTSEKAFVLRFMADYRARAFDVAAGLASVSYKDPAQAHIPGQPRDVSWPSRDKAHESIKCVALIGRSRDLVQIHSCSNLAMLFLDLLRLLW